MEHLELRGCRVGLDVWVDNCIPDCALGKTSYHKLYVTLSGVKWHKGRPRFRHRCLAGQLLPRAPGPPGGRLASSRALHPAWRVVTSWQRC